MKVKTLKFIIIVVIVGFFIELAVGLYFDFKKELNYNYQRDKIIINDTIKQQEKYLKVVATLLAMNPAVIKAYKENNLSLIKENLLPFWKKAKKEKYIYEMHFFKPPAVSFAHFSNFSTCGKDLKHVRRDIAWVINAFKPSTHLYVCKTYPGIRATMPISENGKVLGALSLGEKIDWLPEKIKELTMHDTILIYLNSDLKSLAKPYYKALLEDKIKIGNYVFTNSKFPINPYDMVKKIDFSKKIQVVIIHNHLYVLNKYILTDFNHHRLGFIFTTYDMDKFVAESVKKIFVNITLMAVTALLVYLFFYNQLLMDNLTGLYNINKLNKILKKDNAYVALFNIKSLGKINEAFGFEVGNEIIKTVANKIKDNKDFFAFRIGGDEFALVNKKKITQNDFFNSVKKEFEKIESYVENNNKYNLEISLYGGISFEKGYKLETVDMALRKAKELNKTLVVYETSMDVKDKQRKSLEILNKVRKAFKENNFIVYYQPIVNRNEEIIKYEALIRLNDGDKILTPYQFLPLMQKTKCYELLTKFVINSVIEKFKNKKELVSINFNTDDFLNKEILNLLIQKVRNSNVNIVVEILENEAIDNSEVIKNIKFLKQNGIKIAFDDFGSGYSNFAYLMDIQPDYLKIDGSLIKNVDKNEKNKRLIKSIIVFAKSINAVTVAEFVSSKEIFETVKQLGIDEFQGYYFGKPSPL
jgi:diguanylate cyclase (GGDEF)-like protein